MLFVVLYSISHVLPYAFYVQLSCVSVHVEVCNYVCEGGNGYEITINGYQARKINEIRGEIFSLQLWETFLTVKAEVGMFTKLST